MTEKRDPIEQLLDATGRASGVTLSLLSVDGDRAAVEEGADAACRVPVSIDGAARVLCADTGADDARAATRRDGLPELLESVRRLIDDRETMRGEARQLAEELNKAYEDLYLFSRIATQIRSLQFSEQMLQDLLQETREAMRVDLALALFETREELNVEVAASSICEKLPDSKRFSSMIASAMPASAPSFDRDCFIINDSRELPAFAAMHPDPFRALSVAIRSADQYYGWLLLISFNMDEVFRRGEYRLLSTMAEQLALVVANTDLYRDLQLFVINLVKSLVMAIEAKDVYTKGHSERVSKLSLCIGDAMGLDAEDRSNLQWASILHDLGKIGTPEIILNKPGRLSDEEFDSIKSHPVTGAEILRPVTQLADAFPAIRHHHERYDGGGYPDGLKGADIPLLARIISVADTYDAITSSRAYRAARPHEEAVRILREICGTQLDPDVVGVFCLLAESDPGVLALIRTSTEEESS